MRAADRRLLLASPTANRENDNVRNIVIARPARFSCQFGSGGRLRPNRHGCRVARRRRDGAIRPFHIDIPEERLVDLRRRLAATRWPDRETVADNPQGVHVGDDSGTRPLLGDRL